MLMLAIKPLIYNFNAQTCMLSGAYMVNISRSFIAFLYLFCYIDENIVLFYRFDFDEWDLTNVVYHLIILNLI